MIWRTGRKVGRTIYAQQEWEPQDRDQLIGVMDTPELAQRVVDAVNAPTNDLAKLKMVTELDTALHGQTVARDASPQEVWNDLLGKVRMLQEKDAKINLLYQEVGEMGDRIASQTDAAIKAQDRNAKLESKVKELEAEIIDLKNTVIQRDAEIKKVEIECYRLVQANSKLKQDLEYTEAMLKQHEEATANRAHWEFSPWSV
jgi:chromosome segregation ATPase